MEKFVMGCGFGITILSFFLCVCVGIGFAWGVVIGLIVTLFGGYFLDE